MSDVRDLLERGVGGFEPSGDALERTLRRVRRRQRRRRIGTAVVGLGITAGVVAGLWAAFFLPERQEERTPAGMARTIATIPLLEETPGNLAVGDRELWLVTVRTDDRPGLLMRIDPDTNEVVSIISVPGDSPSDVAVGAGAVWVADAEGRVLRFDPTSEELTAIIDLGDLPLEAAPGDATPRPSTITVAGDFIWVGDGRTPVLFRIDPATNAVVERHVRADEGGITQLVGDEGGLWIFGSRRVEREFAPPPTIGLTRTNDTITAATASGNLAWVAWEQAGLRGYSIMPDEFDGSPSAGLDGTVLGMTIHDGIILWVASQNPGGATELTALDATTGERVLGPLMVEGGRVDEARGARPLVFGFESLWLANATDRTLVRIDPSDVERPTPVPAPSPAEIEPPAAAEACPEPPFVATVVPEGFSREPRTIHEPGPIDLASIVEYSGEPGRLIWVQRLPRSEEPGFQLTDGEPISVVGSDGLIGPIHEGFAVQFTYGDDACNRYSIEAYGVSRADLRAFAQALRPS